MPESPILEQEISQLEQALIQKREALGRQKESGHIEQIPHEKEILREAIREKIQATPPPMAPIPQSPSPPPVDTPSYLSEELQLKVQELINQVFEKSIDEAIKTAKATQNAALIDAFHDALVDEMYSYLVERKKLVEVK